MTKRTKRRRGTQCHCQSRWKIVRVAMVMMAATGTLMVPMLMSPRHFRPLLVTAFSTTNQRRRRPRRPQSRIYPQEAAAAAAAVRHRVSFVSTPTLLPSVSGEEDADEDQGQASTTQGLVETLTKQITQGNQGIPINLQSPKQVSLAIFGTTQKSVSQPSLERAIADPTLPPEQRRLAHLVLQCRRLTKQHQQQQQQQQQLLQYSVPSKRYVTTLAGSNEDSEEETKDDLEGTPSNEFMFEESPSPTSQRLMETTRQSHEQIIEALFDRQGSKLDDYWREPMMQISRPVARELMKQLDSTDCPMGFDPMASPKRRIAEGITTAGKKGSFLAFCREQKELYPQCVILTRMGDFYETFGMDAILLVEHASLNPMGGKAKAGCPYRNVQATLNALVEQGFSVAVYEEVGQTASNKLKTRVLSQIVSPASPTYLYDHNWLLGSDYQGGAFLDQLPPPRPCVGIVHTASGYHMVECSLEERSVEYSERLTSEAVACRLAAYPPAEPLVYIPAPTETSPSLSFLPRSTNSYPLAQRQIVESHLGGYRLRTVIVPPHLLPTTDGPESERYTHVIVDTLLKWNEKKQPQHDTTTHHDLTAASRRRGGKIPTQRTTPQDFTISQTTAHTNPLYLETANQLGLLQDPTIPPLIGSVLDEAAPAVTRRFLKRYLLVPPPPNVAQAMASVVRCLMDEKSNSVVLPRLSVPPLGKCLSLIRAGQASAAIYGELLHTLAVTRFVVVSQDHSLPVGDLLTLCSHESGMVAEHQSLRLRCEEAMAAIEAIICPSHHVEDEMLASQGGISSMAFTLDDPMTNYRYLPDSFVERNEYSWRGRVQRTVAAKAYDAVEEAGRRLDNAIARDFIVGDESNRALITQDIFNNLLVLKRVPSVESSKKYTHPVDRFGKKLSTKYSTEDVEEALSDYVRACDRACEEVSSVLSNLAKTLEDDGHLVAIIQAAHMNLALSAAYHHAVKATKQNWHLAEILEPDVHTEGATEPIGTFVNLWPYWMPKQRAVSNTFDLKGMFLLTAPNMSGKSTLMRSSAAAALLSVCGLCAPLSEGSKIPRFDTLFLRGASADVPAENKSAFGAEMEDMAALMRCCGPRSLVFVDEIGRGTSPRDGARLAAAILEAMSSRGMSGIFATHLHDILNLPLRSRDRIITKQMAIARGTDSEDTNISYEWTYRLEDGVCHDSLATVTAKRFGLPTEIIQRADELGRHLSSSPVDDHQMDRDETLVEDVVVPSKKNGHGSSMEVTPAVLDTTSFQQVLILAEQSANLPAITIPQKANPPPSLANKSCVYILELSCQPPMYYVGETDAIFQRLKSHRAKKKGMLWSNCRVAVIPVESKSEARRLENLIIQEMVQAGYSLESTRDGRTMRQ